MRNFFCFIKINFYSHTQAPLKVLSAGSSEISIMWYGILGGTSFFAKSSIVLPFKYSGVGTTIFNPSSDWYTITLFDIFILYLKTTSVTTSKSDPEPVDCEPTSIRTEDANTCPAVVPLMHQPVDLFPNTPSLERPITE